MTTQPGDPETPIEREDGPEAADVPQSDPSGRVDDEDLGSAPTDDDGSALPFADERTAPTA